MHATLGGVARKGLCGRMYRMQVAHKATLLRAGFDTIEGVSELPTVGGREPATRDIAAAGEYGDVGREGFSDRTDAGSLGHVGCQFRISAQLLSGFL